jgi:hypothetical protein
MIKKWIKCLDVPCGFKSFHAPTTKTAFLAMSEKKKVKQSRYTPWGVWGERGHSSYSFTTSTLDRGEWSASRPGRAFTPGERTPGTHCTVGWMGPRAGLDTEARGKILCPCRGSNPDRPVVQPVVRHYTAWAVDGAGNNSICYYSVFISVCWRIYQLNVVTLGAAIFGIYYKTPKMLPSRESAGPVLWALSVLPVSSG